MICRALYEVHMQGLIPCHGFDHNVVRDIFQARTTVLARFTVKTPELMLTQRYFQGIFLSAVFSQSKKGISEDPRQDDNPVRAAIKRVVRRQTRLPGVLWLWYGSCAPRRHQCFRPRPCDAFNPFVLLLYARWSDTVQGIAAFAWSSGRHSAVFSSSYPYATTCTCLDNTARRCENPFSI